MNSKITTQKSSNTFSSSIVKFRSVGFTVKSNCMHVLSSCHNYCGRLDSSSSTELCLWRSCYVMYYNTNKIVDEFSTDYIFSPALSMITNSKCLKNVFIKTRSYISICISTLPTQHTTFISYILDL